MSIDHMYKRIKFLYSSNIQTWHQTKVHNNIETFLFRNKIIIKLMKFDNFNPNIKELYVAF